MCVCVWKRRGVCRKGEEDERGEGREILITAAADAANSSGSAPAAVLVGVVRKRNYTDCVRGGGGGEPDASASAARV